jgi:hypothetical protein
LRGLDAHAQLIELGAGLHLIVAALFREIEHFARALGTRRVALGDSFLLRGEVLIDHVLLLFGALVDGLRLVVCGLLDPLHAVVAHLLGLASGTGSTQDRQRSKHPIFLSHKGSY